MQLDSQSGIIERAEYLSPDIMPEKITGRDREIEKLRRCLRPMEKGLAPISAWLYGPAGSGKTVIARKVAEQVCSSQHRISLYVNCWERPTLYSVVQALCEQLRILGDARQDTDLKFTRLRHALKNKPVLIILDEIDRPVPKERESIIYQLLQLPKAGLFCISSDTIAFSELNPRVRSKLTPARIYFQRYSPSQTKDILLERALYALALNTYTDNVMERIAALARGNARIALQILLRAAIAAEDDRVGRIATRHIPADTSSWQRSDKMSKIRVLPQHQRLICKLVNKYGRISSKDLRCLYLIMCPKRSIEPVPQRTFSRYLKRLAQGNFISIEAQATGGPGRLVKVVA